jgi:hypothetical protein
MQRTEQPDDGMLELLAADVAVQPPAGVPGSGDDSVTAVRGALTLEANMVLYQAVEHALAPDASSPPAPAALPVTAVAAATAAGPPTRPK